MPIKLVAGLGNPEPRYEMTRHNAGFQLADRLATKYGAEFRTITALQGAVAKFKAGALDVVVLKPHTYMNLSGRSVQAVLHWFKIDPSDMIVAHDDVSLPLGVIRFQKAGGAGGQHGVESILAAIPGKPFDRLKLGVGPDPGGARRADYVLSAPPPEDLELYALILDKGVEGIGTWLQNGVAIAMNKYNGLNFGIKSAGSDPGSGGPTETKKSD